MYILYISKKKEPNNEIGQNIRVDEREKKGGDFNLHGGQGKTGINGYSSLDHH